MKQFLKRLFGKTESQQPRSEWQTRLRDLDLKLARQALQEAAKQNDIPEMSFLRDQAVACGWSGVMLEKLCALCQLYGSQPELGYRSVLAAGWARDDYEMMMVASSKCYQFTKYNEAWQLYHSFDPDCIPPGEQSEYFGQGVALMIATRRNISEAGEYAKKAMSYADASMFIAINAYFVHFELGDHQRVREIHDFLVHKVPADSSVMQSIGWVELARNYYAEGFRLLESRLGLPELRCEIPDKVWSRPLWRGEEAVGVRVLVYEEQGIGDAVMMARYLDVLTSRGIKVLFAGRQQLISLLEYGMPDVEFVTRSPRDCHDCVFDKWVPMMSLPYLLGTTSATVPSRQGYLRAPQEQLAYWTTRVNEVGKSAKLRVGIAWSGNPDHKFDKRRSLDFTEIESWIVQLRDIDFYTLQTNVPGAAPPNLHVMSEEFTTLSDTAALIELMDVVVTVDTSVVHIAGSLGKQTLLMLPFRYEWRWGLEGEGNAWYDSVRIIRQAHHADWSNVLEQIFSTELPRLAGERLH